MEYARSELSPANLVNNACEPIAITIAATQDNKNTFTRNTPTSPISLAPAHDDAYLGFWSPSPMLGSFSAGFS